MKQINISLADYQRFQKAEQQQLIGEISEEIIRTKGSKETYNKVDTIALDIINATVKLCQQVADDVIHRKTPQFKTFNELFNNIEYLSNYKEIFKETGTILEIYLKDIQVQDSTKNNISNIKQTLDTKINSINTCESFHNKFLQDLGIDKMDGFITREEKINHIIEKIDLAPRNNTDLKTEKNEMPVNFLETIKNKITGLRKGFGSHSNTFKNK